MGYVKMNLSACLVRAIRLTNLMEVKRRVSERHLDNCTRFDLLAGIGKRDVPSTRGHRSNRFTVEAPQYGNIYRGAGKNRTLE